MTSVLYGNVVRASKNITANAVVTTMQEGPNFQNFALTGNGQTIPSDTPVVVLTTSATRTGLIIARPQLDNLHARLAVVNASGNVQNLDTTPATSNVANSNLLEVIENNATTQFIWVPGTDLWFQCSVLTT